MGILKRRNLIVIALGVILLLCLLFFGVSGGKIANAEEKTYVVEFNLDTSSVYSGEEVQFNPTVGVVDSDEIVEYSTFISQDKINECSMFDAGIYYIDVIIPTEGDPLVYSMTYEIQPRTIYVTISDIENTYGDENYEYSCEITQGELVGSDTLDFITFDKDEGVDVGSYTITGFNTNENYDVIFTNGTLTISPLEIDVEIDDKQVVYGDNEEVLTFEVKDSLAYSDSDDSLNIILTRELGQDVGEYAITGVWANINYVVNFTNGEYEIIPRQLTIKIDDKQSVYGEELEILSGVITNDESTLDLSMIVTYEKEEGLDVGEYIITGSYTDLNYDITFTNGIYTIIKRDISVSIDERICAYGEDPTPFTLFVYNNDFAYDDDIDDLNITLDYGNNTEVGEYDVIGTYQSENYNVSIQNGKLKIIPLDIFVTIENKQSVYGNTLVSLTYNIEDDLAYNDTEDDLNISLTKENGLDVGEYLITGEWDNDNYNVTFIGGSYFITERQLKIKVSDLEYIYGNNQIDFSCTITEGSLAYDDDLSFITFDREEGLDVGEYGIWAYSDNLNYNIEFTNGKLTIVPYSINVTIQSCEVVYGEYGMLSYELKSALVYDEDDSVLGITLSREEGEDVGEYIITGDWSNDNYIISFTQGTYTIIPKELTIEIDNINSIYGEEEKELTGRVTNDLSFVKDLTGIVSYKKVTGIEVGEYEIIGFNSSSNYDITFVNGKYTISQKDISIEIDNKQSVYGEDILDLTVTIEDGMLEYTDILSDLNISLSFGDSVNASKYEITASYSNSNYNIDFVAGYYTIVKREIGVTIGNSSSVYGESEHYSYSLTSGSLASGEELNFIMVTREEGQDSGEYILTGENESLNYDVNITNGKHTILKKDFAVIISNESSVYGNPLVTLSFGYNINDFCYYDSESDLAITLTKEEGLDSGKYKITGTSTSKNYNVIFTGEDKTKDYGIYTIYNKQVIIKIKNIDALYTQSYDDIMGMLDFSIFSGDLTKEQINPSYTITIDGKVLSSENYNSIIRGGRFTIDCTQDIKNYSIIVEKGILTISKPEISLKNIDTNLTYNDGKAVSTFIVSKNLEGLLPSAKDADFLVLYYKYDGESLGESTSFISQAGSYRLVVEVANSEAYIFKSGCNNYVDIVVNKKDLSNDIIIENALDDGVILKNEVDKIKSKLQNNYSGKIAGLYTHITLNGEEVSSVDGCGSYEYMVYIEDKNYKGEKTIHFTVVLDMSTKMNNIQSLLQRYSDNLSEDEKLEILLEIRAITTKFTSEELIMIEYDTSYKTLIDDYIQKYNNFYSSVEEQFNGITAIDLTGLVSAFLVGTILLFVIKIFKRV